MYVLRVQAAQIPTIIVSSQFTATIISLRTVTINRTPATSSQQRCLCVRACVYVCPRVRGCCCLNMSEIPILPPLPILPDTQNLVSLAATAQAPNSTVTSNRLLPTLPTSPTSAPSASPTPVPAAPDAAASSSSSSSPSTLSSTAAGEREYYDAPGSTVRGSSVWQSIRLIRGDDDHVHCMRCGKDLKHNRTQARLTGTSNLSRHLRKCKGPPLPGTETSEEVKDSGGGGGSEKKRKREVSEGTRDEKKEAAATNGGRASQRAAPQLENGERSGHHASLLQLQTLHEAALARLEQTKQPVKTEPPPQHAEQLSSSELKRMMQWHSTAIQRLQRVATAQLSDEWKERAGKNVCNCCADVESEVQLEPCKHVVWCRGCSRDKCAVCGIAVLGKAQVSSESRGDG